MGVRAQLHMHRCKALVHASACIPRPVHLSGACACLCAQGPGGCVLALTSMLPSSPSRLRTEMHSRAPCPLASRLPPAASRRGVWLSSAPAAVMGRQGQWQVPTFHLLRLSAPASPHIIPMSNRERPFPSGPTGDGATQGHPLAREGSWQAARRRRVMRKETLGFPVPLGSPWGCLGSRTDTPGSRPALVSHTRRRGGWKDLQPCQGGGEGRAGRTSWMSTIALHCKRSHEEAPATSDLPASAPSPWPKPHLSCAVVVASLLGPAQRVVSHPQGSSRRLRLEGTRGGGLWLEERGRYCDKGWFPNLKFSELKGQRVETKEGQKP